VTSHRLARVERAEAAVRTVLAEHGLENLRVRDLGDRASVEVDTALLPLPDDARAAVLDAVERAGFPSVEVDPKGFRSGSMNERLG
jgi:uncharacterized protein